MYGYHTIMVNIWLIYGYNIYICMINIWLMMIYNDLVGGIPTHMKNMSSSVGMMNFPIYEKI
jgi:hypothetical protein